MRKQERTGFYNETDYQRYNRNTEHNPVLSDWLTNLSATEKLISNSLAVNFPGQQNQQRIAQEYQTELSQ